ncbi:ABC-type multidrug transport system fused ATPase/permease subunit [Paenibacillus cellulosilyticus]|uniref:ABC-type multidrug transport system fused ATPase/permease subunit n=1 Tax=Paenibacillus cellulosilyticus TaxID=375489 RepID=A0A2V2YZU4_9BACL|nr:ABC-type multidrug transport system fused ATPase/permease subunit [Paenibacillus cellulosilyticus]
MLGLLGCCLIDSSLPLVLPLLVKFVLDAVANNSMSTIWTICEIFTVIIVILCVLAQLFQYWFGKTIKTFMADLRLRLYHHMEKLPVSYYENTHSGDSMSRITNDLGVVENAYTGNIRSLITSIMTGGYSAALMFYLDWKFASAMIVMGFASTYVNTRFAKSLRGISADIQKYAGSQFERLNDLIAGSQVSRIFQMSDRMNARFKEINHMLARLTVSRAIRYASLNSTNYLLMWLKNSGAFIVGTLMLINGQMTLGTLLSLVLLLEQVTNLFRHLGNVWAQLQSSLAGAARVFEVLDMSEEPARYYYAANNDVDEDDSHRMIEFRNSSFSYDQDRRILDEINFTVKKGQVVALVGPSGGGKSTILKLLLGFYPLGQGEIRIEGKRFTDYTLSELRDKMAYVSQDAYLFEGTIEENIRYGRLDATREEIVAAARAANAHDFITEQADGYDTMVGERGARLSGGQKQRISIARAFLKNPPILLLDEATSALDSESEQAVHQGLLRLMEGKTTIAIAHRLSTIKQADAIYVIDNGEIVEQGTHDELLVAGGIYNRLHHVQERNNKMNQYVS